MIQRRALVAANWKMNASLAMIPPLLDAVRHFLGQVDDVEVAIFPPFLYLQTVMQAIHDSPIILGAQDLSEHTAGAYTGEVSGWMLRDYHCKMVIVGHSERRRYHAEDNDRVAQKFLQAHQAGLIPILCVGESYAERQAGHAETVVAQQLDSVLQKSGVDAFENAIIAYEPVWAIGTGAVATPQQAQQMHAFIRHTVAQQGNTELAERLRILYGGSVTASNANRLFSVADIDGGLIGGASLKTDDFIAICQAILER